MPNDMPAHTPNRKTDAGPDATKAPGRNPQASQGSDRTAKQPVADVAAGAVEDVKGMASDVAQTAKDGASHVWDSLQGAVDGRKKAGADKVEGIVAAMREAADAFDEEVPPVARYMREAARELGNASDALRERSVGDLVETAQDFARRKSGLFLGLAALGGFALVRFLNSSKPSPRGPSSGPTGQGAVRPTGSIAS